jgi:hypothetical protein
MVISRQLRLRMVSAASYIRVLLKVGQDTQIYFYIMIKIIHWSSFEKGVNGSLKSETGLI